MALFSRKEDINEFTKDLCKGLTAKYPVLMDVNSQGVVSEKSLSKILEKLFVEAAEFKTRNKLGVLGKAKLINAFKWELKDLGYSEEFIKIAVEGFTVYTSRK
jgi:hypothetical protein